MRWHKVSPVLRREYLTRVRTRAFWISTLLVPVLMLGVLIVPGLLITNTGGSFRLALITEQAGLASAFTRALERPAESGKTRALRLEVEHQLPAAPALAQRLELKRRIAAQELQGAVLIEPGEPPRVEYLAANISNFRLLERVQRSVERALVEQRLAAAGMDERAAAAVLALPSVEVVRVDKNLAESAEAGAIGNFIASYTLTFLLFLTVMFYGYYVMRGVLEEKSSRVVELVVANVRPTELMVGKIFGVGAVGLTQYAIWVAVGMNLAVPGLLSSAGDHAAAILEPEMFAYFTLFFVLGYFLFASIYAAVGAAFNSEEEAQQMQSVVGFSMAIPVALVWPVLANPDAPLSVVLSMVPIFAPVLFFSRLTVTTPPLWQTITCVLLLVASIAALARLAAGIYRVGILMYGKRPTLREALAWARSS